jgi:hypothetical protein
VVGEERRRSIRALGGTKVQTHSRRHCDSSLSLAVSTASRWTKGRSSEATTSCNSDISHRYVSCDIGVPRYVKESPSFYLCLTSYISNTFGSSYHPSWLAVKSKSAQNTPCLLSTRPQAKSSSSAVAHGAHPQPSGWHAAATKTSQS